MTSLTASGPTRRLAALALVVCLLAVVAAVVSFVQGSWLGLVWVLLAGLTSNMGWYYHRRARAQRRSAAHTPPTCSCPGHTDLAAAGTGATDTEATDTASTKTSDGQQP